MNVQITPFAGADLDAIVSIWNRALPRDPTDAGRFTAWLLGDADFWPGEDSGMFVARDGGRPIGFARAIVRRTHNERLGLEPDKGWLPVVAVDPDHQRRGVGTALVAAALNWLDAKGRKEVWISGGSGSAPGYVFPGVDVDAYPNGLKLLTRAGFAVDHHAVAMSRETIDFDVERCHADAWSVGGAGLTIEPLSPQTCDALLDFLAREFPGDWTTAARGKIRGRMHELLIARRAGVVVGYCQWEGEHFGPFGVAASERNARVGAKLFVEAVRRIRQADGRSVWFNWADPDAERFYRRFGLTPTRRFAVMRRRRAE